MLEVRFKEMKDFLADFSGVRFQGEMACIVEHHLGLGIVALVSLGARGEEERIVLAPDCQRRWLVLAEEFLELGIERDVGFIVADEIELDLRALRAVQQGLVEENRFGRNAFFGIGHAMIVLPAGGIQGLKFAQGITVFGRGFFPIGLHGGPILAQTVHIGIAILSNDGRDAFGKTKGDTKTRGGTVIKDVNREFFQADLIHEISHDFGDIFEGILKDVMAGRVRKAEPGKVRRDDMIMVCQLRDQIAEHVARSGKAMEQKDGGFLRIASLPVKNLEAVDGQGFEGDFVYFHNRANKAKMNTIHQKTNKTQKI
jgi:hypothetical protein